MTAWKSRLPSLFCASTFLFCELISRPWAEMGICDDWSYIRTAEILSRTGHIAYNGWATAILGWQLYLAALFFKLFGFSFTVARMSTLLVGCVTACLLQRTLVRLGVSAMAATLGTLTFVLSPLFMMLSVTFMTDVPGFFAILICFYGCIRALQASTDRAAALWLCIAALLNAICGTSRQIAWLGVLVLVPSTLVLLRSRRMVLLTGLLATALSCVFVFVTLHWFDTRSYVLVESFALSLSTPLTHLVIPYGRALLDMTLLTLPIAVTFLFTQRRWPRPLQALAGIGAAATAALFATHPRSHWLAILDPFMGDWVGTHGTLESVSLLGQTPVLVGRYPHIVLGVLTLGSLICIGIVAALPPPRRDPLTPAASALNRMQLLTLFVPFSLAYGLLLIHRAEVSLYDRYLLAPIFLFLCLLLRLQQRLPRRHAVSAAFVFLLAFYGVVCTHNLFALNRARVAITQQLLAAGVPDTSIDFGWEQDGWVELQRSAYINYPGIRTPPDAYRPVRDPGLPGCHGYIPMFGIFLHLAPRYGVSFDPGACDGPAPFAPVRYSTWPLSRPTTLYLVNYPPPWEPESYYALPLPRGNARP